MDAVIVHGKKLGLGLNCKKTESKVVLKKKDILQGNIPVKVVNS